MEFILYYFLLFFSIISFHLIRHMKTWRITSFAEVFSTFEDLYTFLVSLSIEQTLFIHSALWVCNSSYTQKTPPSDLYLELPISYVFFYLWAEVKWSEPQNSRSRAENQVFDFSKNLKNKYYSWQWMSRGTWTNHKLQKLLAICTTCEEMTTYLVSSEVSKNLMQKIKGLKTCWVMVRCWSDLSGNNRNARRVLQRRKFGSY